LQWCLHFQVLLLLLLLLLLPAGVAHRDSDPA